MKKNIFLIMVISALFIIDGNAQLSNSVGPVAKNRKPWNSPRLSETIATRQYEQVIGPEAKNRITRTDDSEMLPVVSVAPSNITGPRAKNTFPVQNNYRKDKIFSTITTDQHGNL